MSKWGGWEKGTQQSTLYVMRVLCVMSHAMADGQLLLWASCLLGFLRNCPIDKKRLISHFHFSSIASANRRAEKDRPKNPPFDCNVFDASHWFVKTGNSWNKTVEFLCVHQSFRLFHQHFIHHFKHRHWFAVRCHFYCIFVSQSQPILNSYHSIHLNAFRWCKLKSEWTFAMSVNGEFIF